MLLSSVILQLTRFYYTFLAKKTLGGFGVNLIVNKRCLFSKSVEVGNNCVFNGMIVNGKGKVTIGNNFLCGSECMIISQNHNYEGSMIPYDTTFILKTIRIADNVSFGSRVIVTGNVTIGENAIIESGALVCKDVPPFSVVSGNPAKVKKCEIQTNN